MLKLQCDWISSIPKQGSAVPPQEANVGAEIAGALCYFAQAGNLNTSVYQFMPKKTNLVCWSKLWRFELNLSLTFLFLVANECYQKDQKRPEENSPLIIKLKRILKTFQSPKLMLSRSMWAKVHPSLKTLHQSEAWSIIQSMFFWSKWLFYIKPFCFFVFFLMPCLPRGRGH